MRVSYILRNKRWIQRPVVEADAEFIVQLRNQARAKGCINDTSLDVEKQRQWIRDYLKRENEHYWIMETLEHVPVATTSLYNYDAERQQIETGRWVRTVNAPEANIQNTLAGRIQTNDFVFKTLGIKRLVFDVVSTNKPVIKYHRLCGAIETGLKKGKFIIQNKPVDMICFEETPESWAKVRPCICRWAGLPEDLEAYGTVEKVMI